MITCSDFVFDHGDRSCEFSTISKSTEIGIYLQKHQLFKITFLYNSPLINASKAVGISKVVMPSNAIFLPRRERHYVASPRGNGHCKYVTMPIWHRLWSRPRRHFYLETRLGFKSILITSSRRE